jgi:hypothetical protein
VVACYCPRVLFVYGVLDLWCLVSAVGRGFLAWVRFVPGVGFVRASCSSAWAFPVRALVLFRFSSVRLCNNRYTCVCLNKM